MVRSGGIPPSPVHNTHRNNIPIVVAVETPTRLSLISKQKNTTRLSQAKSLRWPVRSPHLTNTCPFIRICPVLTLSQQQQESRFNQVLGLNNSNFLYFSCFWHQKQRLMLKHVTVVLMTGHVKDIFHDNQMAKCCAVCELWLWNGIVWPSAWWLRKGQAYHPRFLLSN